MAEHEREVVVFEETIVTASAEVEPDGDDDADDKTGAGPKADDLVGSGGGKLGNAGGGNP